MGDSGNPYSGLNPVDPVPALNPQEKESLLVLIVINFAEEHALLNTEQLADARASLRALFLRATGEETMLRKLISLLKVHRALNRTFNEMAKILATIRKTHFALVEKHNSLEQQLEALTVSPEENARFVRPLLEFSRAFVRDVMGFDQQMHKYMEAREQEARSANEFRLAQEARDRLKRRFGMGETEDNCEDELIRQKVYQTLDYAEAEKAYRRDLRLATEMHHAISNSLKDFQLMCQMAMRPEMRSPHQIKPRPGHEPAADIHAITVSAMKCFPRLQFLQPAIQENLQLYQRSFGMFMLDFDKFNSSLGPMLENAQDYFQAKEQDEDVRTKLKKLEEIEALIAFIEDVSTLLNNGLNYSYAQFSRAVSQQITQARARWSAIAEPLLHMKVAAEAEFSTRLA